MNDPALFFAAFGLFQQSDHTRRVLVLRAHQSLSCSGWGTELQQFAHRQATRRVAAEGPKRHSNS